MSESALPQKPSGLEALKESFGFESIGKALGIDSLKNIVPNLKKAYELATKNKDGSFVDKIGIFLTSFSEEMEKLDGDKKQIAADATAKVKGIIAETQKTAPASAESLSHDDGHEHANEVDPNEPFVRGKDHFGNTVILRKSAMEAFRNSMSIAEGMGMKLGVTSSYRDFKSQKKLHAHGVEKHGSDVNTWVAQPGHSNHHTGGTVDIYVMAKNSNGKWAGGIHHKNQRLLWEILPKAGFVNYKPEPWHWEIYSERWRAANRASSKSVYRKQASLNA